jgi:hypothetical protein
LLLIDESYCRNRVDDLYANASMMKSKEGRGSMGLGFLPKRDSMCKEIEQMTALRKLDTLLSLCNCCIYKTFDYILAEECRMCMIRKGILLIINEKKRTGLPEHELLDAC